MSFFYSVFKAMLSHIVRITCILFFELVEIKCNKVCIFLSSFNCIWVVSAMSDNAEHFCDQGTFCVLEDFQVQSE